LPALHVGRRVRILRRDLDQLLAEAEASATSAGQPGPSAGEDGEGEGAAWIAEGSPSSQDLVAADQYSITTGIGDSEWRRVYSRPLPRPP
jgi:hypothetical protein